MSEYIAFDSHKRYTWVDRHEQGTGKHSGHRFEHAPGAVRHYLSGCQPGTAVAVEATGNWYGIIDEIEQAGLQPLLVHPGKAKLMMGQTNKTDQLDAQGLNRLQRNGTLPTVWIPPGPLRDLRELTRTRLVLVAQRTRLKKRLSATVAKWGLPASPCSDPYGKRGRVELEQHLARLPEQTRWVSGPLLAQLDFVSGQVRQLEQRLEGLVKVSPEMQGLLTLPGVGLILSATIALEIGEVQRFPSAMHLASYAGTTPRVHASGGKVRYGPLRADAHRYLKWAFAEAANSLAVNHARCPERRVSQLYRRLRARKGHAKAVGAVARHLAEAAFQVLRGQPMYQDPSLGRGRTSQR
ncbi:MAG: IS110 family transposase [Acidobacteria bacterium]|nr:IS110 family transposase [Acidobacteriota bacterium]